MSWEQFLQYLSDPNAIPIVVGLLLSWVAEYIPVYAELMPRWKRLAFLGLCLIVPTLAALLGVMTCAWSAGWDVTWWPALLAGGLAFGAGTVAHTRKLPDKAELFIRGKR